jgi:hypothetical protein
VPRVSAFYGIVIWMYHDEIHHLGRPHFHARCGGDEASLTIESVEVIAGGLPFTCVAARQGLGLRASGRAA